MRYLFKMLNNNLFGTLDVISNILQILNYYENTQQTSNDRIMKELQHQNKEYLEIIIRQNKEILERLNNARKNT